MKSYKNRFPFPVGSPSYVLPVKDDNLLANVRFLKDRFDLVQLLCFGKDYMEEILSPHTIRELLAMREKSGITYTVHLPSDLGLLNAPAPPESALDVIERVLDATAPLAAAGYVLHLDLFDACVKSPAPGVELRAAFGRALDAVSARMGERASGIYIENIGYDLALFGDLLLAGPFPVCMDAGHLLYYGQDTDSFMRLFGARVRQIHLHGHMDGRDHRPVPALGMEAVRKIMDFARVGCVPLVVEVYSEEDLAASMECMEGLVG